MAQGLEFVEFITDQVDSSCKLTHRMMFGGCTLYLDGKVVALVCDDQLYVKPTNAGRAFIGDVVEAPAYPGAKNSFLIEDQLDDGDWLTKLLIVPVIAGLVGCGTGDQETVTTSDVVDNTKSSG